MKNNRKRVTQAKTYSVSLENIKRVQERAKELQVSSAEVLERALSLYFEMTAPKETAVQNG